MQVPEGTCVIVTGLDWINLFEGKLWLSELYLRLSRGAGSEKMITVQGPGELWMTRTIIQGDGQQGYTAVAMLDDANLLVEGTHTFCVFIRESLRLPSASHETLQLTSCVCLQAFACVFIHSPGCSCMRHAQRFVWFCSRQL